MNSNQLTCPACKSNLSEEEILLNCSISWPIKNWLLLNCPNCNNNVHVKIENNLLETGELDGAPGPCFITHSMKKCEGLSITCTEKFITCNYKNVIYKFMARNKSK